MEVYSSRKVTLSRGNFYFSLIVFRRPQKFYNCLKNDKILNILLSEHFLKRFFIIMIRDYSYLFKVVLVGNSSVGKSSIIHRFADDSFQETYLPTIGVDFRFK